MSKRKSLHMVFDDKLSIGSWPLPLPHPETEPYKFLDFSKDIGWHFAYALATGARSVKIEERDDDC